MRNAKLAEETSLAPLMAINGINNRILLKIAGIGEKKALVNGKQLYSLPPIARKNRAPQPFLGE
ncbi:MAG: hypothetical protein IPP79_11475 [Chitinophagaceae bacterium]|nr:hypothetical protein [Chitinophagaceae bacterium]